MKCQKCRIKVKRTSIKNATKEQLAQNTNQHIMDVNRGLAYITKLIRKAGNLHDNTKFVKMNEFYDSLILRKDNGWFEQHIKTERHHLEQHTPDDVNLVDILEYLVDGIMAGLSRSGTYNKRELPEGLLKKAFDNTVDLMMENIDVEE